MPAPPHALRLVELILVPTFRGAVEPLVHPPEAIQPTGISGIGVIDVPVLEHECAHARPVARVGERVRSAHGRIFYHDIRELGCLVHGMASALIVILDASLALLLLGERDVEVGVEVVVERGRPGKRPPHPHPIGLYLCQWRTRHYRKRYIVVRQVDNEAVEPVRDGRAGRTPRRVVGTEHVVVDKELRPAPE